jgi:hypothetical protein
LDCTDCRGWRTAIYVVKKIGYQFKEGAFFSYLFKEEIDDEFVKLFKPFQIFKQLPDFTKHTKYI